MREKTVLLMANLDTRGAAFAESRQLVTDQGLGAVLLDFSMEQEPPVRGDISCEEVAEAGGLPMAEVRRLYREQRKTATDCMIRGAQVIVARLYSEGRIHGILGAGGATSTLIVTSVMKRLPFGFPKVMASSVASVGVYLDKWVGTADITMLNTVVDVMGNNPLLRRQLANAVGAVCGMVKAYPGADALTAELGSPRRLVGITSFGFAERSVERCLEVLPAHGFQPVPFHAQGQGDRAMDGMIRAGTLAGVMDMVPRGVGEQMLGGDCAAGPDRLLAAADYGIPQVVAPGGFDQISVGGMKDWRGRFAGRRFSVIDEVRVEMRTSAEECARIGEEVAARLNRARAPYLFLLPLGGFSSLDAAGRALYDPEADAAFARVLRSGLADPGRVEEVDANLYSPRFADACVAAFLRVWAEHRSLPILEPPS
jgi:uncharacterized protein (UPF0261 family)